MSLLKVNTVQTDKLQSVAGVNRNSVLQVVSTTADTAQTTSSTTFIDLTGMSLAITPTSATSKILIMGTLNAIISDDPNSTTVLALAAYRLMRDSTEIFGPYATSTGNYSWGSYTTQQNSLVLANNYQAFPITYLDSPSTTSEITYKFQGSVFRASNILYFNVAGPTSGSLKSTITLMEIAQ